MKLENFKYLSKVLESFEITVRGNILSPDIDVNIIFRREYFENEEIKNIIYRYINLINFYNFMESMENFFIGSYRENLNSEVSDRIERLINMYCNKMEIELNIYFNNGCFKYEMITDNFKKIFEEFEVYYDYNYNSDNYIFNHQKSKIKFKKDFNFLNCFTADGLYIILQNSFNRNIKLKNDLLSKILEEKYYDKLISNILEHNKEYISNDNDNLLLLSLSSIFELLTIDRGYNIAENEILLYDTFNNLKNFIENFDNELNIKIVW